MLIIHPPIPTLSRTNIPTPFHHHPTFHAWPSPLPIFPIIFSLSSRHTHPSPTCAEPGIPGCPPCPCSARLHKNPQSRPSTRMCPMHTSRPIPHFFFAACTALTRPLLLTSHHHPLQSCGHSHQPPWRQHLLDAMGLPPLLLSPWCCRRWELPPRMISRWRGKL